MYKKVLITPYFGEFPEWMDKFEIPDGYDWILDTDYEGFKKRVKDKLGIEYEGKPGTGKVWDFRGALGVLYEDEIKDYDFWGHIDFDVIFGDVYKWVSDDFLSDLDVHSNHHSYICGCWTLYRNVSEVNNLFRFEDWQKFMKGEEPNGWVEQEFSRLLEKSGLRYKYTFWQGDPYSDNPKLEKKDNKLYQDGEEIMMFHFRKLKKWLIPTK
jgi:hypothetical protein